eukprot:CAMPEP_0185599396 /NCGR_PEP_ID=MMETSP0434-20130131/82679_1 /TAXON_ID=626734 ORGANISM="Favella taraikaensis, Strain Fe Narragansett Bay" /NCGR_SAMPLE_ID=MMETSP0434 /ASSEMBLY_ACC=CAM_ASM_000379 /LENGTH=76 /DNA_ID=CAMNT_0028228787 /DNA_START=950 /DNA_END=1180 /DNA_ORIENTATION=-
MKLKVPSRTLRRMNQSPKSNLSSASHEIVERSPELKEYLAKKFEDKDAYAERQSDAKSLKLTTPFIRAGFIDKKKL